MAHDANQYPQTIYRIILEAPMDKQPTITVTAIPCKITAKQIRTAHRKVVLHGELMRPASAGTANLVIDYVYVLDERRIDEAVQTLQQRARDTAAHRLAVAEAMVRTVGLDAAVTREAWGVDTKDGAFA